MWENDTLKANCRIRTLFTVKMIVLLDMEGEDRMKELYIVRDVPRYEEECSNYCYVVKAESHAEAIDIVRKKTKHQWDWEVELADNKEVWE